MRHCTAEMSQGCTKLLGCPQFRSVVTYSLAGHSSMCSVTALGTHSSIPCITAVKQNEHAQQLFKTTQEEHVPDRQGKSSGVTISLLSFIRKLCLFVFFCPFAGDQKQQPVQ